MLSDEELALAARDLESDLVERKESLTAGDAKDKVGQAICAFANDLPGHRKPGLVLVGVSDRGAPVGLAITDQLLITLADMRSAGNILPLPTMVVEKRQIAGIEVAVVLVQPAADPPVAYKGVIWIRVGPRRAIASREEERRLTERRRHGSQSYDEHPMPGTTIADLDLLYAQQEIIPAVVAAEVLAANERTIEERLGAIHLLTPDGQPTVGAILLCGRDPKRWRPGAYVQFVRFAGVDQASPIIDHKELHGTIAQQARLMDDLLTLNVHTALHIGSGSTDEQQPDYPVTALQQLVRNALLHRNYETTNAPIQIYWFADRVEIVNPGGLYGRVTPQNFGQLGGNDYRNPVLATFFKALRLVQRFGVGIHLARKACAENGNPPPEFAFEPGNFAVVVRRTGGSTQR